jgi:multicomponent Na+:H+ antiporter subunit G
MNVNLTVSILLLTGSIFILISAIGLIRFKDLLSRMHASTKATSFGILLLLIGICIFFNSWSITLKSILIILFIYITAPLAAHAIAKSFKDTNESN